MKRLKVSLIFNIIIVVLVLIATVFMFAGIRFMHGHDLVLQTTKFGMLKYFTVLSNLLMAVVSIFFIVNEIKAIKNNKEIEPIYYLLKFIGTSAVSLTFFIVFTYLVPAHHTGIMPMIMNSNLFYHLIVPLLSIITFVFFEKTSKIPLKYSFYGMLPTIIYGLFYLTNVLVHTKNGQVEFKYDWYGFVQSGVWTIIIVLPIVMLISYLISFALWKTNNIKVRK